MLHRSILPIPPKNAQEHPMDKAAAALTHDTPALQVDPSATQGLELARAQEHGLYDPRQEHDACGVGFVAHIKGHKAHAIVQQGLKILRTWTIAARWVRTR